jgi:polyribonucleotide nucleotidyltransferase
MKKTSVSVDFGGKPITFETGELAPQATSSILARVGDTVILATVVLGRETELGYFPLSVEYVERLYAGGRIKGSRWVKREGKPTDDAVLTGRLIDRSIRPLFPKEYKREVQVIVTVLSVDGENSADILALNAVSAALAVSPIPWSGPVAAIRMGLVTGEKDEAEYLLNPTNTMMAHSTLDLVVTQSHEKTVMLEAGAKQVPEANMFEAIKRAHAETGKMLAMIEDLVGQIGMEKEPVTPNTAMQEMAKRIEKTFKAEVEALAATKATKEGSGSESDDLVAKIVESEKMQNPDADVDKKLIMKALEYVMFQTIRTNVVKKNKRVDGRKMDEVREIGTRVSLLPRTHGSAVFQRGITQVVTIATLGSPRMEQLIESAEGEESKRYIHHYNMPPYSVGEAGRFGFTSRREIGHGALAERALEAVIPSKDKFPYTIRLVSEVTSSNGSTSMASTCGSTMALMDAGVPIIKPVSGISVGMMSYPQGSTKEGEYTLLTDIIGLEDFSGDMDFKVAGTDTGITAIQLDVKIPGLTLEQVEQILERARVARMDIMGKMLAVLDQPRDAISIYAPKIEMVKIPVEKIGELIGPGGKIIKNIIATTGAEVDVEDDGTVTISGVEAESVQKALAIVEGITKEVNPGEVYEGEVKRILPFGAFVEFLPSKEGMVHVSKMAKGFVQSPEDVVQIGDKVTVKILEIDDQGRINLTMILDDTPDEEGGQGGDQGPRDDRGPRTDRGGERRPGPSRGGYGDRGGGRSFGGPRAGGGGRSGGRSFDRPSFSRGPRDDRGPAAGGDTTRSEHPLSRQFQRERTEQRRPAGRSSGRKAHY